MNDPDLDKLRHMWDGSEDWVLHKYEHRRTSLTVWFKSHEPTLQEIAMVRKLLPEYEHTPPRVLRNLVGDSGRLEVALCSMTEAKSVAERGRQLGLKVDTIDTFHITYLPQRRIDSVIVLTDDEALAERVWTKMIEQGVPVVNG